MWRRARRKAWRKAVEEGMKEGCGGRRRNALEEEAHWQAALYNVEVSSSIVR